MKSLSTALVVLEQFMGEETDLGVAEVAERTGLPKSRISKILSTFRERGLLRQDPRSRRYSVGPRAFVFGSRFVNHNPLCREALPLMRALSERTGHSVRISVMDGDDVIYLVGVEGPLFMDTGWRVGQFLPIHATSVGRMFLAGMPEERARALLARGTPALTAETVTDAEEIMQLAAEARRRGFARNRNETAAGLGTLAVPILGRDGETIGALSLAFPSHVMAVEEEPRFVAALHATARTLSQRMGSQVYPFGDWPQGASDPPGERLPEDQPSPA